MALELSGLVCMDINSNNCLHVCTQSKIIITQNLGEKKYTYV